MMNQRQIATALGVSQTTVSLVLNNPKTEKISEQKRNLILDFLKENDCSIRFNDHKIKNIAYLYDPQQKFFNHFINGIQAEAKEKAYNVIIEKYHKGENLISPNQVINGIIFEGKVALEEIKKSARKIPTVILNSTISDPICDMIYADNWGGIQLAINYFLEMGHSRIAYFSVMPQTCQFEANYNQRLDAFIGLVRSLKLEKNDNYIQLPLLKEATTPATDLAIRNALKIWREMKKAPTAIICSNDFYALRMIRQANILGIKIPDEFSLIGIDNLPAGESSFPALTSVDHNTEEMGRLSVETLIKRLNNPNHPTRKISCNASLNIRESVLKLK